MVVFIFFFKQKTAYEMRISDWSSDVCSSDLAEFRRVILADLLRTLRDLHRVVEHGALARRDVGLAPVDRDLIGDHRVLLADPQDRPVRDHAVEALDRKSVV